MKYLGCLQFDVNCHALWHVVTLATSCDVVLLFGLRRLRHFPSSKSCNLRELLLLCLQSCPVACLLYPSVPCQLQFVLLDHISLLVYCITCEWKFSRNWTFITSSLLICSQFILTPTLWIMDVVTLRSGL